MDWATYIRDYRKRYGLKQADFATWLSDGTSLLREDSTLLAAHAFSGPSIDYIAA